jgi:hypothetical protein
MSIIDDILSIDIKKYDWKKDINILKTENLIVKNTDIENEVTFQFVIIDDNKLILISNTGNIEEEFTEDNKQEFTEDNKELTMSFIQIVFTSDLRHLLYDYFKEEYKEYIDKLDKIPTLKDARIHIIPSKSHIPLHIDQEHIGETIETDRANMVLSLTAPDNSYLTIGENVLQSKENPVVAFNAQYIHGAYNYSDEDWVLLILHIPTAEVKEI